MKQSGILQELEYGSGQEVRREVAEIVKPPRRMSVSEAAKEYLRVRLPGGSYGEWDSTLTPYLEEPMDCLNNRNYEAVVIIGPAGSGKTILGLGWMAYIVVCDPGDMMIVHTQKELARDFSRREVERAIRNSPELDKRLSRRSHDDNTFDKVFKTGNMLSLAWPTIQQISSRTIKFLMATDYDRRLEDDVNGEGDLFGLLRKRNESFMSSGKTLIETSPGFPILDPKWRPSSQHEAPPCDGALSIYNLGDRRRLYWPCPFCFEYFPANSEYLVYEDNENEQLASQSARMECPHCHNRIEPHHRRELNLNHKWLREGEEITAEGEVLGNGRQSNIASFWFEGPVACFQTWQSQVLELIRAEREYEATGSEERLKRTVTQDQGRPYLPKAREKDRSYVDLMDRAEDLGKRVVPIGCRFIVVSIDVQKDAFIIQVEGFGVGLEHWYIDRFKITKSPSRLDEDGDPMPIRPASHKEDWDVLPDQVFNRSYPLGDGSGKEMRLRWIACDSGGKAGVTREAYKFYRRLRARGMASNFMLVKGTAKGPRIMKSFPDSERKDRRAGARGEIPVHLLNVNLLKDSVDNALGRTDPGPGCSHFPDWFDDWWYKELVAEIKDGEKWVKVPGRRNESLDLTVYNRGCLMASKGEEIDWLNPPGWADQWDKNTLVFDPNGSPGDGPQTRNAKTINNTLEDLGRELG